MRPAWIAAFCVSNVAAGSCLMWLATRETAWLAIAAFAYTFSISFAYSMTRRA